MIMIMNNSLIIVLGKPKGKGARYKEPCNDHQSHSILFLHKLIDYF